MYDKKEAERKAAEEKAKKASDGQGSPVKKEPTSKQSSDVDKLAGDLEGTTLDEQGAVPGGFSDADVPETEEDVERILNDVTSGYDALKNFVSLNFLWKTARGCDW